MPKDTEDLEIHRILNIVNFGHKRINFVYIFVSLKKTFLIKSNRFEYHMNN